MVGEFFTFSYSPPRSRFIVTGETTDGKKVRITSSSWFHASGINLLRVRVWHILDGKRKLVKRGLDLITSAQDIDSKAPLYWPNTSKHDHSLWKKGDKLPDQDARLQAYDNYVASLHLPSWHGNGKLLDIQLED